MTGPTRRDRLSRLVAAAGAVTVLVMGPGCSGGIRDRPDTTVAAGTTSAATGAAAPGDALDTASQAWELAALTPPGDAETVSVLARPTQDDLPSYLVVLRTTPEQARALCDQLGGRLPVGSLGLGDDELAGWALEREPPGELGVCQASKTGDHDVQRDVLIAETDGAETDGAATVWLSTYRMPR